MLSHTGSGFNDTSSDFESPLAVPSGIFKKITWFIMLPVSVLFFLTIPDCRRGGVWAKLFPLTFILSIAWLGGLSYVMVWMVSIIGTKNDQKMSLNDK